MSNGVAYVIDESGTFSTRLNHDMVDLNEVDAEDLDLLRKLIHEHEEKTVSARARNILVNWDEFVPLFRKVLPKGAEELVNTSRANYLETAPREADPILERRTA